MKRVLIALTLAALLITAGCADVKGDSYSDAPDEIKDGSLDYQDYKDANCPYLESSLDQKTMKKCNAWIRNQSEG